jgi:hypothetical protein
MKKKFLILCIVLLLLVAAGIGGYVYLKESTTTVIRSELSDRSKEFITSRKKDEDAAWQTVNLDNKRAGEHDFDSQTVTVKNCYTVVVPFQISDDRTNEPCVYYAILQSPRGNMTTNLRSVGFQKVEDSPDVHFRRGKKDIYREESVTIKNQPILIFTDITGESGKTAFTMVDGKIFSVSMNISAADELQVRQMKKIVESLELE